MRLVPVDAQVLLAHVVARERAWLVAHRDDELAREQADAFFALAKRRREGEPVAYLTGTQGILGPAVARFERGARAASRDGDAGRARARVDCRATPTRACSILRTGSGAIALAIAHERPRAHVIGHRRLERGARRRARQRDATRPRQRRVRASPTGGTRSQRRRFDVIVSNPPYVAPGDPHLGARRLALRAARSRWSRKATDSSALRTIVADARRSFLAPRGALAVEHGYDQSDAVQALFRDAGFSEIVVRRDLAGIARVVGGRLP